MWYSFWFGNLRSPICLSTTADLKAIENTAEVAGSKRFRKKGLLALWIPQLYKLKVLLYSSQLKKKEGQSHQSLHIKRPVGCRVENWETLRWEASQDCHEPAHQPAFHSHHQDRILFSANCSSWKRQAPNSGPDRPGAKGNSSWFNPHATINFLNLS